jgi:hypothetical protein
MPESSSILQRPEEEDLLWDGQNAPAWVACNQLNKTCYSKILGMVTLFEKCNKINYACLNKILNCDLYAGSL